MYIAYPCRYLLDAALFDLDLNSRIRSISSLLTVDDISSSTSVLINNGPDIKLTDYPDHVKISLGH